MNKTSLAIAMAAILLIPSAGEAKQMVPARALEAAALNAAAQTKAAAFIDVQGCGITSSIAVGVAERRSQSSPTTDMPLKIASVSKLFTAAAIVTLAQRGMIDLDQRAGDMLLNTDAVGVAGRDATLRQLLNHTGGVPDYYDLPGIRKWDWRLPLSPERVLSAISGRPATGVPGARYAYSNSGYHLAALAVERKLGRSFAQIVNDEVIFPLGLRDTAYREAAFAGELHGYVGTRDWYDSAENSGPDGGITATMADLRTLLGALFLAEEGPLRSAGMAMTASAVDTGKPRLRAGMGTEVRESRSGKVFFGHTGDVEGYLTFAYAAPEERATIIGHLSASEPKVLEELLRSAVSVVEIACQQTAP